MEQDICSNCDSSISITRDKFQNDFPFKVQMDDYPFASSFDDIVSGATEEGNGNPSTRINDVDSALTSFFKLDYLNAFHRLGPGEKNLSLCQPCSVVFKNLYQLYNNFVQLRKSSSLLASRIVMLEEIMDLHAKKKIYCELEYTLKRKSNSGNFPNTLSAFINSFKNRQCPSIKNSTIGTQTSGTFFGLEPRVILTRLPPEYSVSHQQQQKGNISSAEGEGAECTMEMDFDNQSDSFDPPYDPFDDADFSPVEVDVVIKKEVEDDESEVDIEDSEVVETSNVPSSSSKNKSTSFTKKKKPLKSKIKTATSSPARIKRSSRISAKRSKASPNLHSIEESEDSDEESKPVKKSSKSTTTKTRIRNRSVKKKTISDCNKDYGVVKTSTSRKRTYLRRRAKVPNPCWYCPEDFPTPLACSEHTQQVHVMPGSGWPVCHRCSKICTSQNSFDSHLTYCESIPSGVILAKQFQCTLCSVSCCGNNELKTHMLVHSTIRPFPCELCSYAAKSEKVLIKHVSNIHKVVTKMLECDECEAKCKSEFMLRRHKFYMHTQRGGIEYEKKKRNGSTRSKEKRKEKSLSTSSFCTECNIDYFSRRGLILHQKSCHLDNMGSLAICELCGDRFLNRSYLKKHLNLVHSDKRPFLCTKCGKDFKSMSNLKKHDVNTHSEEGRIKFNAYMRERNRRKKLLQSQTATSSSTAIIDNSSTINIDTTQEGSGSIHLNPIHLKSIHLNPNYLMDNTSNGQNT